MMVLFLRLLNVISSKESIPGEYAVNKNLSLAEQIVYVGHSEKNGEHRIFQKLEDFEKDPKNNKTYFTLPSDMLGLLELSFKKGDVYIIDLYHEGQAEGHRKLVPKKRLLKAKRIPLGGVSR